MPVSSTYNGSRLVPISKSSQPSYERSEEQVEIPNTANLTDTVGNFVIVALGSDAQ